MSDIRFQIANPNSSDPRECEGPWPVPLYDILGRETSLYMLPDGGHFNVCLTRNPSRKELVTRRETTFGGQPTYWYEMGYDLLGRPTNATDSVSLVREWQYNSRSELAAATIGTNAYGYAYDSIGNREWTALNGVTNTYAANALNQYTSLLCASDNGAVNTVLLTGHIKLDPYDPRLATNYGDLLEF